MNDAPEKPKYVVPAFDPLKGEHRDLGGSRSDHWNAMLLNQVGQVLWKPDEQQFAAAVAALRGIAPKDELEGMMAAQLIAAHAAAMDCYRRAAIPEQTFLGRQEALSQANKLSRTYASLLEALNRHRGKGQQVVRVEHVNVNVAGDAVVGVGGDRGKIEGQAHEMRRICQDDRSAMPVICDAERPLQVARRQVNGCSEGQ